MPYKSEKIKLNGLQDRRRKLTEAEKIEIKKEYASGLASLRSLGKKYGVTHKSILLIVNPVSAEKGRQYIKDHWRDYQQKGEEWAAVKREHRRYKQSLYLKGELK